MKTIILCGGKGARLREETEFKPKPLVEIGGRPILWHIMEIYAAFGHKHFILTLGYKGEMIKEYFMHYDWRNNDFQLSLENKDIILKSQNSRKDWLVDFVDTGQEALTALRLYKVREYLRNEDNFMLTYGDGVADINIDELIKFHQEKGKIITITGLRERSGFGVIQTNGCGSVEAFKEKPISKNMINGGFMVVNKKIFEHLDNRNVMLVDDILPRLADRGEVALFQHTGFWRCMDTYRDYLELNKLWEEKRPWAVWEKESK